MKKQNESGNLRHKIVYSKELTALEKRYLLELMMTKQTESNSESGWIPCSERMPEPGVNVLVTDGINQMVTWHEVIDGKAMWVDNFIVYVNVRFGEVTHWMPLPDPPGGDKND